MGHSVLHLPDPFSLTIRSPHSHDVQEASLLLKQSLQGLVQGEQTEQGDLEHGAVDLR